MLSRYVNAQNCSQLKVYQNLHGNEFPTEAHWNETVCCDVHGKKESIGQNKVESSFMMLSIPKNTRVYNQIEVVKNENECNPNVSITPIEWVDPIEKMENLFAQKLSIYVQNIKIYLPVRWSRARQSINRLQKKRFDDVLWLRSNRIKYRYR